MTCIGLLNLSLESLDLSSESVFRFGLTGVLVLVLGRAQCRPYLHVADRIPNGDAGLEPDNDVLHRGSCAEVDLPHLLDEGYNLRARDAQRLAHRWAPARVVGGPRNYPTLLAHVCDVSHREAEEDESERECVLREIGRMFGAHGGVMMQMQEESYRA